MREHLLGYVLGALDPAEQQLVERCLETDPELRRLVGLLEKRLAALDCLADNEGPPAGLAERTCSRIPGFAPGQLAANGTPTPVHLESAKPGESHRADAPHRVTLASASDPPVGKRWSMPDMLVAACIALAACVLFFPAMLSSRHESRVLACQNNLRTLGMALANYSDLNGDRSFPYVQPQGRLGVAGIYGTILNECELLPDKKVMVCPASSLAGRGDWRLPTIEELESAAPEVLARLHEEMGGSYAYSLGFMEDGFHRAPRNSGRQHFAILADAPASNLSESPHHSKCRQNVLFENLSVKYVAGCVLEQDDIYRNGEGRAAAGVNCDDSVLGNSATPPMGMELLYR